MKKNVKHFLAVLLAGTMVAGCLAGCGNSEPKTESSKECTPEASGSSAQAEGTVDSSSKEEQKAPITTDPITISILTTRHGNATNEANDVWIFRYLEYWLNQQGYNVTIDVQQSMEAGDQLAIMLGTDSLPDLIWGPSLSTSNAVIYGAEEGMLLDWTPYLNEETMPNLMALFEEEPDALAASTCIDGAVYSLPYMGERTYGETKLCFSMNYRVYIDSTWMEECNVDMPATMDEFLDMLRAFKNKKLEGGEEVIPLVSVSNFLEKMIWIQLGHYGNEGSAYGTTFTIKDGEVVYPAFTEDYRTFIEIMNTCYTEGLISQDFFTMDSTTARGLMTSGVCGVACDWTLNNVKDFQNYVALEPFAIGDNEVVMSLDSLYRTGALWANADTEYPEVLALMLDYLYSPEGSMYHWYGPMEGQDPLGMLDGWFLDEEGNITTKLVEDGTYESMGLYAKQYVYPYMYVGNTKGAGPLARALAGAEQNATEYTVTDVVTGKTLTGEKRRDYSHDTADEHWRLISMATQEDHMTAIRLPGVYMTEEDSTRAAELSKVISDYVKAESAKFITGTRPISEIDAFWEELKKLDIEEYIALYKEAYSSYMEQKF